MVGTALASPVRASVSTLANVDLLPLPRHVVIRLAAPVSADAPGLPSSLTSLPLLAALAGLVEQMPLAIAEDELCSPPDLNDEHLCPEVLLHIAYEVVSELDMAEEFRLLSLDENDLCNFLEDQITSLQLVVRVQDTAAPSVPQDSLALVQDSCPCSTVLA
jgi:hypothetical protein